MSNPVRLSSILGNGGGGSGSGGGQEATENFLKNLRTMQETSTFQPTRQITPKINTLKIDALLLSRNALPAVATKNGLKAKTLVNVQYKNIVKFAARARHRLQVKLSKATEEQIQAWFPLAKGYIIPPEKTLLDLIEECFASSATTPSNDAATTLDHAASAATSPFALDPQLWLISASDLCDMPIVPAGPHRIRFARSMATTPETAPKVDKQLAGGETKTGDKIEHWDYLDVTNPYHLLEENQQAAHAIFGTLTINEDIKVVELVNFGFNRAKPKDEASSTTTTSTTTSNSVAYFVNIGSVILKGSASDVNNLPIADRLVCLFDLNRQSLPYPKMLYQNAEKCKNAFVTLRIDQANSHLRGGEEDAVEEIITTEARTIVKAHYVGIDQGTARENVPEAFYFRPPADSPESLQARVSAQIDMKVIGPGQDPNDLELREYIHQYLIHGQATRDQCYESGIVRLPSFVRHMMANPIPFIGLFTLNTAKTKANLQNSYADPDDPRTVTEVQTYSKLAGWQLREWLRQQCVPVSRDWVFKHFGSKQLVSNHKFEEITYKDHEEIKSVFPVNKMNNGKDPKVLNLSEYQFAWEEIDAGPWKHFVVSAVEVIEPTKHTARLPEVLKQCKTWPTTPEEGDALLSKLKDKSNIDYLVFAHAYTDAELSHRYKPHPIYAGGVIPQVSIESSAAAMGEESSNNIEVEEDVEDAQIDWKETEPDPSKKTRGADVAKDLAAEEEDEEMDDEDEEEDEEEDEDDEMEVDSKGSNKPNATTKRPRTTSDDDAPAPKRGRKQ